jgi:large subunit ribosomal protein L15
MPLVRRVPKRGFRNIFRKEYKVINLHTLNRFEEGSVVDPEVLKREGIVKGKDVLVKVLGEGELEKKLTVCANAFSKSAREKIAAAGGEAKIVGAKGKPEEKQEEKKKKKQAGGKR